MLFDGEADCYRPTLCCDVCGARIGDLRDANLLWDAEAANNRGAGLTAFAHKSCSNDPRHERWHWCGAEEALEQVANNANPNWPDLTYRLERKA